MEGHKMTAEIIDMPVPDMEYIVIEKGQEPEIEEIKTGPLAEIIHIKEWLDRKEVVRSEEPPTYGPPPPRHLRLVKPKKEKSINPKLKRLLELIEKLAELKELKRIKAEREARDRQPEPNRSDTITDPSRDNH
jgi:hypothetical protein